MRLTSNLVFANRIPRGASREGAKISREKQKPKSQPTYICGMKNKVILMFWLFAGCLHAQTTKLYDGTTVHSIYITLPADSLKVMIDQLVNTRYMPARFVYVYGTQRDTVQNVGIRLRGNTSLSAQKKSFKISFNEFVDDRKYQGVKKLNLRGSHNDPSMMREKLWFDIAERAGELPRRSSFVRLYINQEYRGLYTNLEEVDKEWLGDHFVDNDGNLYKCTYPANLEYLGTNQQSYKNILNNPTTRAYDLTTNETADDYSDLVNMLQILNEPYSTTWPQKIEKVLDVESVIRGFAIDVATGHWDDYFYNMNNYYLYRDSTTRRFSYFAFDTDNTMGIDWLNRDWATRDALDWLRSSQPRPLGSKIMEHYPYLLRYITVLDSMTRYVTHPDTMARYIDYYQAQITPAASSDQYRTLDYGYTMSDFLLSTTEKIDAHSPYGIKPFFGARHQYTMAQLSGLVPSSTHEIKADEVRVFPNPTDQSSIFVLHEEPILKAVLIDLQGRSWPMRVENDHQLELGQLPIGMYFLQAFTSEKVLSGRVVIE